MDDLRLPAVAGAVLLAVVLWAYRATAQRAATQYDRLRNADWLAHP